MDNFNRKPNFKTKPQTTKHKPVIKDLYHELLGKEVVCIQKGGIKLIGAFHTYEKGVLLFLNAYIHFNYAGNTVHIAEHYASVFVDRTSIQMMFSTDAKLDNEELKKAVQALKTMR